jgi:NAD-dependent SIR2 family protein deacetylase
MKERKYVAICPFCYEEHTYTIQGEKTLDNLYCPECPKCGKKPKTPRVLFKNMKLNDAVMLVLIILIAAVFFWISYKLYR